MKCVKQNSLYPIETKRRVEGDSHEWCWEKRRKQTEHSFGFLATLRWDLSAGGNSVHVGQQLQHIKHVLQFTFKSSAAKMGVDSESLIDLRSVST